MAAVTITNPGGESGDLTGWTTVSGTWASSTGAVGITPRTGLRFIYGTAGGGILQQDCAVDSGDEADIDAGRAELTVSVWVATAAAGNDRGVFQIMFLDGDDNLIGEHPTDGNWEIESQSLSPGTTWTELTDTYRVSPGTRKVRFQLVCVNTSGGMDVGFDDIAITIAQAANRPEGDFPLALAMRNTGFDFTSTQGNNVRPLSWIDLTSSTGRFRSRSDFNTPISSPFHASGAGGSSVEGEQLIDLHAEQLASWIADGRLTLRFKSYVSTISDDFGRIGLRFYDEDMTLLSTELDERFQTAGDMNDDVWSEAVFFCPVPTNARFVGAYLRGDNTGGSNTAFCFEDVELQAHVLEDFGAVGQFHTSFNATTVTINANEKHGAVHTIATNDLEVHRLGFFANAALAANVRGVIYGVDGSNNPTDLVVTSDQITSLRRGWNEVVFSSPPTLTAGQNYWIGFITDTAFVYRPRRHGATPAANSSGSDTYADGPADPFGTPSALGNNVPAYVLGSEIIPPATGESGKGSIVIVIT